MYANYFKNQINGLIIDTELLGRIKDAKIERLNSEYKPRTRHLAIKKTINSIKDVTTETQRMLWLQKTKVYLEKFKWKEMVY